MLNYALKDFWDTAWETSWFLFDFWTKEGKMAFSQWTRLWEEKKSKEIGTDETEKLADFVLKD